MPGVPNESVVSNGEGLIKQTCYEDDGVLTGVMSGHFELEGSNFSSHSNVQE